MAIKHAHLRLLLAALMGLALVIVALAPAYGASHNKHHGPSQSCQTLCLQGCIKPAPMVAALEIVWRAAVVLHPEMPREFALQDLQYLPFRPPAA
jgi:hypothetical protein